MFRLPSAFLGCVLCAAAAVAQIPPGYQGPGAPVATTELLQRLGAKDTPLWEGRTIAKDLAERPAPIRQQAFDVLLRRCGEELRNYQKAREKLAQHFGKSIQKTQRGLLGPKGEAKVATLREQSLAISHTPDLTKERIHSDLDPLYEQLRAMLLPTPAEVIETDATLAAAIADLRVALEDVRGWFELEAGAQADVEQDPAGKRHVELAKKDAPVAPAATAVDDDLELWSLTALPLGARDVKALETNASLRGEIDPEEYRGTLALNRIRIVLGLPALTVDLKLGNAARDHSGDMKKLSFFSHESPVEGKRTFSDRAARAGTSASAENIAAGHDTGEGAIRGWWYSPGHHKNMLGGHVRTGLGRCENVWTQMFGG